MPRVVAPRGPLETSPTLRDGAVVLADGRVAARSELPALARWVSLKLRVGVERYPFESSRDRAPRVAAVRALLHRLAGVARWRWLQVALGARAVPPGRAFTPAAFAEAVARVALQRFNANAPAPLVFARTGAAHDLQYEWSFAVTDLGLYLFAHDTPANRAAMDGAFAAVRASAEGAVWATLGHGYAGSLSSATLGLGTKWGLRPAFHDHDEAQLTPPWRMHVGRAWLAVPAAARRLADYARRTPGASLDDRGLLVDVAPPDGVDRSAARLAAWRAHERATSAAGRLVNAAFHDAKARRSLG